MVSGPVPWRDGPLLPPKPQLFHPPILSRGQKILQLSQQLSGKTTSTAQENLDSGDGGSFEDFYDDIPLEDEDQQLPVGRELYSTETTIVIEDQEVIPLLL